ncbi:stage II sporulation protein M [Rhodocytophaga rosea]|uniref:Stage II sporulation protein M n=1 Tax=Rhodocytophaga rosea TaxID=2704465 RepID=A0A6C0GPA1_9BACT|nr:stage II sporulation protein M [Rhodocytophaga rosea]QHT69876.1 stage II sporulation protein M [Rhodocytophaga rosea]
MREALFIKNNTPRWQRFESLLSQKNANNPDLLADLFIQLTDDLSFARTNYPESQTTVYLNNLTAKVHQSIYRNKKEEKGRFVRFWKYELPQLFYSAHKQLLYSFLIFAASVLIGAVSTANDMNYVRLAIPNGDAYVNMTLENIKKGDPMAVYKSMDQGDMFFQITLNNIFVSFKTFAYGLFISVGTVFSLFSNGVMLGSFQYFFYQKGLLLTSVLTIWIHGTLEISAIVIAGCAGMVMGNSLLFPGTYSRIESLKMGAKKGLKICVGLVPIFIVAGFLEGFVTRHTEWPSVVKLAIILVSASFIVYYFIIYPIRLNKHAAIVKQN